MLRLRRDGWRGSRAARSGSRCRRRGSGRRASRSVNGDWPTQAALAAHVGDSAGAPLGIHIAMPWQPMPAMRAAAFGHLGRGVVRAARAEVRRAHRAGGAASSVALARGGASAAERRTSAKRGDRRATTCGVQLAGGQQSAVARLVGLADHARPACRPASRRAAPSAAPRGRAASPRRPGVRSRPVANRGRISARAARSCRPCSSRMPSAPRARRRRCPSIASACARRPRSCRR